MLPMINNGNVETKSKELSDCQSIMYGREEFDARVDKWMTSVQRNTTAESIGNPKNIYPKSGLILSTIYKIKFYV